MAVTAALLAVSSLAGCSTLNPLSLLTDTPSITAQVGKENESNDGLVNSKIDSKVQQSETGFTASGWNAQTITVQQTKEQPLGLLYLTLLIAGWVLPDPVSMLNGLMNWLRRKENESD